MRGKWFVRLLGTGTSLLLCAVVVALVTFGQASEASPTGMINIDKDESADLDPPEAMTYETWFGGGTEVVFDHNLHVDDLELDCAECHHLATCGTCHFKGESQMLVSSSQVAMHGACFRCHEQEPGGKTCGDCHTPKESIAVKGVANSERMDHEVQETMFRAMETAKEELAMVGARLPATFEAASPPEDHLFITSHNGVTMVAFDHALHAEEAELACASCHHLEGCRTCHQEFSQAVTVGSSQEAVMDNCIRCHDDLGMETECEVCHTDPHR